jgi:hypothetical protein
MNAKQFVRMVAEMKTEKEYGKDTPPSEDLISERNGIIVGARSVREEKKKDKKKVAALAACKALVDAYQTGEHTGGSIDWSELDIAYEAALTALGKERK